MRIFRFKFIFFVFLVTLVLYHPFLRGYFSQDDFFHLKITRLDFNFHELINFFAFKTFGERGDIYFYRPLSRECLYWLYQHLFGFNPLPFRLTQLGIHFANIVLVYKLILKLLKNDFQAKLVALFFAIFVPNLAALSFLAGGIQVSMATLFILLTLNFFNQYLLTSRRCYGVFSGICFLLALGCHELSLATPLLLFGLVLVSKRKAKAKHKFIKILFLFFLVSLALIGAEVLFIGLPTAEKQYQLIFNPIKMVNSYFWYFVWSLGLPEMVVDFVGPGLKLNPNLVKYWGNYFSAIFPLFGIVIIFWLWSLRDLVKNRFFWFFSGWFLITIGMMVILPFHRQSYYLIPALPATSAILAVSVNNILTKNKFLGIIYLVSLLGLNFGAIKLGWTTSWTVGRSRVAEKLVKDVKESFPTLPKGAVIYFLNDSRYPKISDDWKGTSSQASVALSGSDALQLVYDDPSLKVYYEDIAEPTQKTYFRQKASLP